MRIDVKASQFFVTNTGKRVVKLYEDVNRVNGATTSSKGKLSASIFRIMIEANAKSHDLEVGKVVATCLQHGEGTALSYYYLFYFRFEGIFGNEPYVNMTPQLIIEKLIDSGKLTTHPGAAVTLFCK